MKSNSITSAGAAADNSTQPIVNSSADIAVNPMLAEAFFKPILFSTTMVQAILDGRKTMTRRKIKDVGVLPNGFKIMPVKEEMFDGVLRFEKRLGTKYMLPTLTPNIQIGNFLWVRETWHYSYNPNEYIYKADCDNPLYDGQKWKPSIFMPKEACRLFLQVTDIKVERLQEISNTDAENEGLEFTDGVKCFYNYLKDDGNYFVGTNAAKSSFKSLWEKINGKNAWQENPFVWVYTFKVVECPYGFR